VTPFRQPIYGGDRGSDVLAVRRALRSRGHRIPRIGRTAGPEFVKAVRRVQANHDLAVDGVYGPKTHALLAPAFDRWGVWLYQHAAIRARYVNPFARAQVVAGRIDMGVDYHGTGPILAIGDATIVGLGGTGWPGSHYLLYRLENGPHAGHHIYVAEAIEPSVRPGQRVRAGETIASFGPGARYGFYPGIETGWGSPEVNLTLAAAMGNTGGFGHSNSPAGICFARFLHRLGAPVVWNPGPGPEYPLL
jgi:Putative peptidoglycan binding domain